MGKSRRSAEGGKRGRDAAAEDRSVSTSASTSTAVSFESALEQLEATVARLEEGEMPLEEALELFESGVKLSRQCTTTLEEAERRIEILVADRSLGEDAESVRFDFEEESAEGLSGGRAAEEDFED
jgi:exodeoxyribonuclease VII small subunit